MKRSLLLLALVFFTSGNLFAQDRKDDSFVNDVVVHRVLLNPATYGPAIAAWFVEMKDWESSQPLFANGSVEENPRYTISGLPHDKPVGYSDGNRVIATDIGTHLLTSSLANLVAGAQRRMLLRRFPGHGKLINSLYKAEVVGFSVTYGYVVSIQHYHTWRDNVRIANQMGY